MLSSAEKKRMEDEIFRLSTVIKRTPAGTERDKLYHQRAKYRRALSVGKGYTPNNPKYGLNTQDEDCRTKNPKVKLHVIEQRLDHELLPTERLRLRRKREKLRKQIYESKVEEPPTLKKLKEELDGRI